MRTGSTDRGGTGQERGGEITTALVTEMTPLLHAFCRRYVLNSAVADDVVQQTFEIALRSSSGLREPSKVRAWMFTIARRESLRVLRAHASAPLPDDLSDDLTPSPESQAISGDILASVSAGLDALPVLYRQAVVLRDVEGLTYAEIVLVVLFAIAVGLGALDGFIFRQYLLFTRLIYPAFAGLVAAAVFPLVRSSVRDPRLLPRVGAEAPISG